MLTIKQVFSIEKQQQAAEKLMIIIKKMPDASFGNSVDLLNAITAAGIPAGHFAEVNMTEKEKNCIQTIRNTQ